jgi:hypothetical protein
MKDLDDGPDGLNDAAFERALLKVPAGKRAPAPTPRHPRRRSVAGLAQSRGEVAKSSTIRLRVTPALYKQARAAARAAGVTMTRWAIEALETKLTSQER